MHTCIVQAPMIIEMASKDEDLYYEFLYPKICIGARPYTPLLATFCGYSRCSCPVQICTSRLVYGKSCTPKSSSSHAATRELEMPLCGKVIAYPTPSGGLIVLYAVVSQMRTVVVPWEALRSSLSSIFPRPDALLQSRHLHARSLRSFPIYHSAMMHLVLI